MSTCDPLVTDGTVKGTVPLSVANLRTQNKFYDGRIICAIGTKQADDGTQAVILVSIPREEKCFAVEECARANLYRMCPEA